MQFNTKESQSGKNLNVNQMSGEWINREIRLSDEMEQTIDLLRNMDKSQHHQAEKNHKLQKWSSFMMIHRTVST